MSASEVNIKIEGKLDENTSIPNHTSATHINVDLEKLTGMNSIGLRNFIIWCEAHRHVHVICMEKCPTQFINNINFMGGVNKSNLQICSFIVPFYSEGTDEFKDYLFVLGKDFFEDGTYRIPELKDSAGNIMEIDVHPGSFFKFLKKP